MLVGIEWLIDAEGCETEKLREVLTLQRVFVRVMKDLHLKSVGEPQWHKFPAAFGVTGLIMLTESHLACHTYPEFRAATFNLYCCRERPEWNWAENLREILGAEKVTVRKIERGNGQSKVQSLISKVLEVESQELKVKSQNLQSQIRNPKSHIAGGNE